MFHQRDVISQVMQCSFFHQTLCLLFCPKSSIYVSPDQRIFSHMLPESFTCSLANSFTQQWFPSCTSAMKTSIMACCRESVVCPTGSPISAQDIWCDSWVLSYLPDQGTSFPDAHFGQTAKSRKIQGWTKLLPFQNYWGRCGSGNTQNLKKSFISLPWSMPCHSLIVEIHRQLLGLNGLALDPTMGPYRPWWVPLQTMVKWLLRNRVSTKSF